MFRILSAEKTKILLIIGEWGKSTPAARRAKGNRVRTGEGGIEEDTAKT